MNGVVILKNGRILDPSSGRDEIGDLWIQDGVVVTAQADIPAGAEVFDVTDCWVVPGLIDMHVHLREPGEEYKETIASGTAAAAAGGFTAVACMPNTHPINDNGAVTAFIKEKAEGCPARVYPVGAISQESKGVRLAEFGEMKLAGAVALSDDGRPVENGQLMRRGLEYGRSHDMVLISHAEELTLSRGGSMNEGELAVRMGLSGIPAAAESVMVYRDICLAELTGARLHIAHVSTAQALELIRSAKARGVAVTAETAPHYFTLTEDAVKGYDTHAKMSPPLRTATDVAAVREALRDGTLDAIATDHAPHSVLEKEVEFDRAANGITGLETALPLGLALVREEVIDAMRLIELLSSAPAQILGVPGGSLAEGALADVTVIDPDKRYTFDAGQCRSKGRNTPFDGWEMQGAALLTVLGGRVIRAE